jgi:hypothetical protein
MNVEITHPIGEEKSRLCECGQNGYYDCNGDCDNVACANCRRECPCCCIFDICKDCITCKRCMDIYLSVKDILVHSIVNKKS